MIPNTDLSSAFEPVLDPDEKIVWIERPLRVPYLVAGFGELFFCFFFLGAFLIYYIATHGPTMGGYLMGVVFMAFSFFDLVKRQLYSRHACYAYTNKRILIRYGARGKKMKVIEFDNVVEVTVEISSIESHYGTGSIKLFTGEMSHNDAGTPEKVYIDLEAITDPFVVFHNLKDVMSDFKATA